MVQSTRRGFHDKEAHPGADFSVVEDISVRKIYNVMSFGEIIRDAAQ